jgi:hypothetical protein
MPAMSKDAEISIPWDMEDEALAIIVRHRPDLEGKTLEECRTILQAEVTGKRATSRPVKGQARGGKFRAYAER